MKKQIGNESNILIVDDEVDLLETLQFELQNSFSTVFIADSASAALAILQRHRIDCLVTDYRMPQMSGLELAQRANLLYPAMPTILMTGMGMDQDLTSAFENGLFDFLEKPFRISVLVNRIRNALVLPRLENLVIDIIHTEFPEMETVRLFKAPHSERLKLLSGLEAIVRTRLLAKKGKSSE